MELPRLSLATQVKISFFISAGRPVENKFIYDCDLAKKAKQCDTNSRVTHGINTRTVNNNRKSIYSVSKQSKLLRQ